MKPSALVVAAAVVVCPLVAHAQLLGRIPPAPEPTPEFTPPAPVPPPAAPATPPKPAEPEKPLPTLVERDEAGKLKRYEEGSERAAIEAFEFDAEARAKIAASRAQRAEDVEHLVVQKLPEAIEARKTRAGLNEIKDFNEFARIKDVAAPLATERLVDRLMRDGAVTPMQRNKIDQIVKEYEEQLKLEWQGQTGTDILKIASLIAREKFQEVTRDAMEAMDRLMLAAGSRLEEAGPGLGLRPEQQAAYDRTRAAVADAADEDAAAEQRRLAAVERLVLETLDAEQQKKLLEGSLPPG